MIFFRFKKKQHLPYAINVNRQDLLSPKARRMYNVASRLLKISRRLDKNLTVAQDRMKEPIICFDTPAFMKTCVNRTAYTFIISQLK